VGIASFGIGHFKNQHFHLRSTGGMANKLKSIRINQWLITFMVDREWRRWVTDPTQLTTALAQSH
jgi:hypothetical protein